MTLHLYTVAIAGVFAYPDTRKFKESKNSNELILKIH